MSSVGWESTIFHPFRVAHFLHFLPYWNWVHLLCTLITVGQQQSWHSCHCQSLHRLSGTPDSMTRPTAAPQYHSQQTTEDPFEGGMCVLVVFWKSSTDTFWEDQENTSITIYRMNDSRRKENPGRVRPWTWRSFRNFLTYSLHLFLYGCTRVTQFFLNLCLIKSERAFFD